MPLISIEEAIEEFRQGKFLIIVDDAKRENEGDLTIAAEAVTAEAINFMITNARGMLCVPVTRDCLERLNIPMMAKDESEAIHGTAYAMSIDYLKDNTTGISAYDRAATIRALLDPTARPEDFAQPGHTFPLRYCEGGVLARPGHTEASVDLARLAGMQPAAAICEVTNQNGTMARMPDLEDFSREHGINLISIAQLIAHRRRTEKLAERVGEARLPTQYADFTIYGYRSRYGSEQHAALVLGSWEPEEAVLVRIHSQCSTGDVFGSLRCDCGAQVEHALQAIAEEGKGVFIYMGQEGRGIGLHNKILSYHLQDDGLDTVEANEQLGFEPDPRSYSLGAQILVDLGVRRLRLMTNNPRKITGLSGHGLEIVERIPAPVKLTKENRKYLKAKHEKLGHIFSVDDG